MRGVAALLSATFSRPRPREFEDHVEKPAFCSVREKARAKFSQHSVVDADVSQLQAQPIPPVDPRADRIGGLSISQPLHEPVIVRKGASRHGSKAL